MTEENATMQTVDLVDTGRRTTRLGFGCSSIMGGMDRKQSLQTLEWAFEAGVRHFDVAPMYGYGAAEACLGEFLARHRNEATVTTKFGIPPGEHKGWINVARTFARPLIKAVPALKARAQRAAASVSAAPPTRNLSPDEAQRSLENSLRQLRVERVDVFLLHDVTPEEVGSDSLLKFLEQAQRAGKIGSFGIGTSRDYAATILHQSPGYAAVVQQEWSVFDPIHQDSAFHIHHRSLAHHRSRLQNYLSRHVDVAARWSSETGADLSQPGMLGKLMMRAALLANPKGIVLFSSKDRGHIQSNAALAEASSLDAPSQALYRIVQREAAAILKEDTA